MMGMVSGLFEMFGYEMEPYEEKVLEYEPGFADIALDGQRAKLTTNWAGQPMKVISLSGDWCETCGGPLPHRTGLQKFLYGEAGHYCLWWTSP